MPVIIPRKLAAVEAPPPAPEKQADPALTRAEVDAMLAQRDALWMQQINTLSQALASAVQAFGQPKQPASYDFKVEYRQNGAIETIRATPRKGATP